MDLYTFKIVLNVYVVQCGLFQHTTIHDLSLEVSVQLQWQAGRLGSPHLGSFELVISLFDKSSELPEVVSSY